MGQFRKQFGMVSVASLLLAGALGGVACSNQASEEAVREGLAVDVGGLDYTVFLTRQLNPEIPPDSAYYEGPPPSAGVTRWGVFLEACNDSDRTRKATDDFVVVDNQGNEFRPIATKRDNPFAYHAEPLQPHECIPETGSVADLGPAGAAMLLFELPLQSTENRPLTLIISPSPGHGSAKVELDL